MKQKFNQIIRVLLLFSLLVIVSCEKEDLSVVDPNVNRKHELPFKFKSVTLNGQSLKQFSPTIGKRVDQLNAGTFQKSSNLKSTIIDTSYVKVLQSEEFDSYIFRVIDSTLSNNHYKNYVIVEIRDTIVNQYMVNYYLDESHAINTSLSTVEPIFGDDLINQVQYKCGGNMISVTWVDGYYTENRCSAGGNHTVAQGDECSAWGTTQMATRSYTAGSWQTQTIAAEPCSGGGGGGGSSGGGGGLSGGGSNNNPPDNDDPETIGIGIVPNLPLLDDDGKRKECKKIRKLLLEKPQYKADLVQLAANAANSTFEKGIAMDKNGNNINIPNGVGGMMNIPLNPSDKYSSIAHIHDANGNQNLGTFSVPSLNDLSNLGLISVIYNKIDLSNMVYFVFTADGTYYALTINNPSKFKSYWAYHKLLHQNSSLTALQREQYQKVMIKRGQTNNNGIYHKYFNNVNGSLIDETSTNNEQQLKYFLQFLDEDGGMGVSVFETDAQLSQFTKIDLNNNSNGVLKRETCN